MIGPNGAGKIDRVQRDHRRCTSRPRATSGSPASSIAGLQPHQITQLGVARTFQSLRLFLNMTVMENVMAATYGRTKATPIESILRLPRARREEREVRERRRGRAVVLRPAAGRLPLGPARLQPLLRQPPAARDRPRAGHPAADAAARRAGRRDEPERDARGDRADRAPARRARASAILVIEHDMHVVEGMLRSRRRARPRRQDHRGRRSTRWPTIRRWSRPIWDATRRRWPRP